MQTTPKGRKNTGIATAQILLTLTLNANELQPRRTYSRSNMCQYRGRRSYQFNHSECMVKKVKSEDSPYEWVALYRGVKREIQQEALNRGVSTTSFISLIWQKYKDETSNRGRS